MPIEFRCTQCQRLLRTADDSAGKQAKCPGCGLVLTVPAQSSAGDTPPGSPPPLPGGGAGFGGMPPSPFGSPTGPAAGTPFGAAPNGGPSANPYQSPGDYAMPPSSALPQTPLTATVIDMGDAFNRTWALFKEQYGMCLAVALIGWLVSTAGGFVIGIISGLAGVAAQDPNVAQVGSLFGNVISSLFSCWLSIGVALGFLAIGRGQPVTVGVIFTGGRYLLAVIGGAIVFTLAMGAVMAVCVVPAMLVAALFAGGDMGAALGIGAIVGVVLALVPVIIVSLMFSQYFYLILDRDLGPIEALSVSRQLMVGNKATIFVLYLLVGLVGVVLTIVTCGLGALFGLLPFTGLLGAMLYLLMSGQPTAGPWQAYPTEMPRPVPDAGLR